MKLNCYLKMCQPLNNINVGDKKTKLSLFISEKCPLHTIKSEFITTYHVISNCSWRKIFFIKWRCTGNLDPIHQFHAFKFLLTIFVSGDIAQLNVIYVEHFVFKEPSPRRRFGCLRLMAHTHCTVPGMGPGTGRDGHNRKQWFPVPVFVPV